MNTDEHKCDGIRENLTQYLLGDLAAEQMAEIKAHLQDCEGCRTAADEIEPTLDLLRDALAADTLAPVRLPESHRAKIRRSLPELARIFDGKARGKHRESSFAWFLRPQVNFVRLAAVVVVVATIMGAMLLPAVNKSRQYARRAVSTNLPEAQIVKAPDMYKHEYGRFDAPIDEISEVPSAAPEVFSWTEVNRYVLSDAGDMSRPPEVELPAELAATPPPSPLADFSPSPSSFDSVAMTKSPMIMKGFYGSRIGGKSDDYANAVAERIALNRKRQQRDYGMAVAKAEGREAREIGMIKPDETVIRFQKNEGAVVALREKIGWVETAAGKDTKKASKRKGLLGRLFRRESVARSARMAPDPNALEASAEQKMLTKSYPVQPSIGDRIEEVDFEGGGGGGDFIAMGGSVADESRPKAKRKRLPVAAGRPVFYRPVPPYKVKADGDVDFSYEDMTFGDDRSKGKKRSVRKNMTGKMAEEDDPFAMDDGFGNFMAMESADGSEGENWKEFFGAMGGGSTDDSFMLEDRKRPMPAETYREDRRSTLERSRKGTSLMRLRSARGPYEAPKSGRTMSDSERLIQKLKAIKIPEIDFREANIHDVIDFLQEQTVAFDASDRDERQGVNMVLNLGRTSGSADYEEEKDPFAADESDPFAMDGDEFASAGPVGGVPLITFSARDISAYEALKIVTEISGLKYRVDDNRIMVIPVNAPDGDIIRRMYDVSRAAAEKIREMGVEIGVDVDLTNEIKEEDLPPPEQFDWIALFGELGVPWPTGSSVKYVPGLKKFVVANTEENLEIFEDVGVASGTTKLPAGRGLRRERSKRARSPLEMVVEEKLDRIKLPEIDFREANVLDILEFLTQQSMEHDPGGLVDSGKGITFVADLDQMDDMIDEDADPFAMGDDYGVGGVPLVTFSARNISLHEALKIVTEVAELKFRIDGRIIRVMPLSAPGGPIVSRSYDAVPKGITGAMLSSGPRRDRESWKKVFANAGVRWPDCSTLKYIPRIGKLIVAGTASDLAMFETVLEAIKDVVQKEIEEEDEIDSRFKAVGVNPFVVTKENAFSTFAIDVDTASYTLARNYMLGGKLPPAEAVRTEEFVNFFDYAYKPPTRDTFRIDTQIAPSKFGRGMHMLKIGVKGRRLGREEKRQAVLTFVIDASGSMNTLARMGLVKKSLAMLVQNLDPKDRVAIIQFGSHARIVLEHTEAQNKEVILQVIDRLQTSGSTNLEEAMRLGYQVAARGFVGGAANRVLVMSDGAANLGANAAEEILADVETYKKQGIQCSVFGFGIGTYNDEMLETLANKGDGAYSFIDSEDEARRLFVDDLGATLNTIASDVKIQVEFNPDRVKKYRQLGYENRQLKKEQFRDDTVDAGEVGSGQSVTALYELQMAGDRSPSVALRAMEGKQGSGVRGEREGPTPNIQIGWERRNAVIATVRVRYRRVDTGAIEEIEHLVRESEIINSFENADVRFKLAIAVAELAEMLRGSPYAGSDYEDVARLLRPIALELSLDKRVQELSRLVGGAGGMSRGSEQH